MVIQTNMSPKAIFDVWEVTEEVFKKHNISLSNETLDTIVKGEELSMLLHELNTVVGSTTATCVAGG
ncbi:Uncharacterised protein [Mycobacteroides abscessus subsp. abscessus]|nr:Uncharacterised protein [Mycobacteroides abscessus subsp. abscessus]